MWKVARALHKKSSRDESGLFLIEGPREIELAAKHGVEIVQILDRANTSPKNIQRISYCGQIVAVAKAPERSLRELALPENPLIVVLDNLEKPGNIGAIIRTAEAAGVSAAFVCGGAGDLQNPNLIRASLGAVFCMPVFSLPPEEAAAFLSRHGITAVTASPDAKTRYYEYDFSLPAAVVVGSEAEGISSFWARNAAGSVAIPMTGEVNSLNVSASASILIYEAIKQRNGHVNIY